MSKAVIELELTMQEFTLLQKVLKNYQGKMERLNGKELGADVTKRIADESEILNKLIEELSE